MLAEFHPSRPPLSFRTPRWNAFNTLNVRSLGMGSTYCAAPERLRIGELAHVVAPASAPATVRSMVMTPAARVLVVDDDVTIAEVIARYLEREGFAVETVGDGRRALDVALD